jgi:hypothetical protein
LPLIRQTGNNKIIKGDVSWEKKAVRKIGIRPISKRPNSKRRKKKFKKGRCPPRNPHNTMYE